MGKTLFFALGETFVAAVLYSKPFFANSKPNAMVVSPYKVIHLLIKILVFFRSKIKTMCVICKQNLCIQHWISGIKNVYQGYCNLVIMRESKPKQVREWQFKLPDGFCGQIDCLYFDQSHTISRQFQKYTKFKKSLGTPRLIIFLNFEM